VDTSGNAYVSGLTVSNDFPKTPGALGANRDRGFFLSKLDATGSHLIYSGILCPYDWDRASRIAKGNWTMNSRL
jgi:hypothetical protein